MLYMNSATRTISVVWNVQPRQCKNFSSSTIYIHSESVGEAICYVLRGTGQGTLVETKGEITFHHVLLAMPWLRHLVTDLSSQRSGYDPMVFNVAFQVGEVALGRFSAELLRSPPSMSFNQCSMLCYKLA
jgi:hypothetical protein